MTRTILVVDDAEICRDAMEVTFGQLPNMAVHAVETAEQALDFLAIENICALVTDVHLPRMDGFELVAAVRALPSFASLPILVISGDTDPTTPARLAQAGANAYFTKPYSPAAVCSKLEQLVNDI